MVVAATVAEGGGNDQAEERIEHESRRFGSGADERKHLVAWVQARGVEEIVMESTAQYWKPVWLDLEPHFGKLHLAQAHSNKAPKGRKNDAEQRAWRTMTRTKQQLVRDRVRLQNQLEALSEEARIKLVVGWSVGESLTSQLALAALEMAIEGRKPKPGLVHHSDRGTRYASHLYISKLESIGALASMSRPGRPWENGKCESFMRTIKK